MALVNPIEEARRRKGRKRPEVAKPRPAKSHMEIEAANCRPCVNPKCGSRMTLAASRGHRVLVCMSCMTSLPVTAEWQITGEKPPKGAIEERSGTVAGPPVDMHRALKRRDVEMADGGGKLAVPSHSTLDVSWLKPAAAKLNISPSIRDYVMAPTILFFASVPNRNGLGFLEHDLVEWSTESKMPAYKSWRGAPIHVEHDNKDPSKASGVVLDTFMQKHDADPKAFWKVMSYLAVDRTKSPELAKEVLARKKDTWSMGAYINGGYACSLCGQASCGHIPPPTARKKQFALIEDGYAHYQDGSKHSLMDDRRGEENASLPDLPVLAFAVGKAPHGFEVSSVGVPAYPMAQNTKVEYF